MSIPRKAFWVRWSWLSSILALAILAAQLPPSVAQEPIEKLRLWPAIPPGDEMLQLAEEKDLSDDQPTLVADQRIIRLANVTHPDLVVFKPKPEVDTGTSVVICPGGGYQILAYDLEGTEVAAWLNSVGVTGIVVKYRVPARDPQRKWKAAVQDAQRAVRLVRANAMKWGLRADRVGILGFSAGGDCAVRTSVFRDSQYDPIDSIDQESARPNFSIIIYPGYLYDESTSSLQSELLIDDQTPPMFIVHAQNDPVTVLSSVELFRALKKQSIPAELHIFDRGGHGYGLRKTENPVTEWPKACERWMKVAGWLTSNGQ